MQKLVKNKNIEEQTTTKIARYCICYFIICIGFCMVYLGFYFQKGLYYSLPLENAKFTVYEYGNHEKEFDYLQVGVFSNFGNAYCERIDTKGDKVLIDIVIKKLHAKTLLQQNIDGIKIYYGYSYILPKYVTISNNKKANIMIALNKNVVSIGYPLLAGSY